MVHTAELTYEASKELYDYFRTLPTTHREENWYYNNQLREYGIRFSAGIILRRDFGKYSIKLIINFKRVIEQDQRVDILRGEEVPLVDYAFNNLMEQHMPGMPRFADWNLKRIDYCVNVRMPNVSYYVRCLQKCDVPYFYRLDYDANRNYVRKPGSVYLVGKGKVRNRSTTINIYDKYDQWRKEGTDPAVLEQARDILRIEVQCHKTKTDSIRKKYGLPSKKVKCFLDEQIAYEVLEESINRITRYATFQRRAVAMKLIQASKHTKETKDKLIKLVSDVAVQHQNIAKVRNRYEESGYMNKDTFRSYLEYLEKMDVNAVTVPNNVWLEGKTYQEGLPRLLDVFHDAFYNEMGIQ